MEHAVEREHQRKFDSNVMNIAADNVEVGSGGRADRPDLTQLGERQMREGPLDLGRDDRLPPPCWLCRSFSFTALAGPAAGTCPGLSL